MPAVNQLTKLAIALHYSTPAVLGIVVVYSLVVDKTFGLFKLMGSRLPKSVLRCMRFLYAVVNALAVGSALFFVFVRCNLVDGGGAAAPYALRFEQEAMCLPVLTLTTIVALCTLWTDRIAVAFLQLPAAGHLGLRSRMVKATTIGCAFMALATNDPYALLLLLVHGAARPAGVTGPKALTALLRYVSLGVRMYAFAFAVFVIGSAAAERVAGRSAAIVLLAATAPSLAS